MNRPFSNYSKRQQRRIKKRLVGIENKDFDSNEIFEGAVKNFFITKFMLIVKISLH